ncbi:MAG: GIY-YIG nuclease family protein [Candidatus Taylorbacteria bacterium]|nr:GIY-YIG nuclease family protein [Candidatus Taylorbacteria bacterium]
MNSQPSRQTDLIFPDTPGVYLFKKGDNILYIGKATSLKDRIESYFSKDIINTRGPLIVDMVFKADKIDFLITDSVLEALILESELIKKHQPKYNTKEKDDKSYNYVVITDEDFPRVLVERSKNIDFINKRLLTLHFGLSTFYGPFTNGTQLKEALKIVRKIFPFRDRCSVLTSNILNLKSNPRPCFNYQIGLCPGVCIGKISKKEYAKTIRNIKLFFEGKKTIILKNLEKEMHAFANMHEFEKAGQIKKTIFALNHIQDVSLRKFSARGGSANNGKTILGNSKPNDIGALKEILERRFKHPEWTFPQIIVVDGGKAQINIAKKIIDDKIDKQKLNIKIVSVVKNKHHKPRAILGDRELSKEFLDSILLANSEAHRFAIKYHKSKRKII